ncbi:MAG: leucine-rich repeat domain-containing protein [Mollicutes bacterium PWAP]|nr:leucine-rich repeat domain-containing protein [Mollicutes bacterium PWAP]
MKKRSKYLLNIGNIIISTMPIVTVISCGSNSKNVKNVNIIKKEENYEMKKIKSGAYKDEILSNDFLIPPSVENIEEGAFENAIIGKLFSIPDNINIEEGAFENAKLPNNYVWSSVDANSNPKAGANLIKMPVIISNTKIIKENSFANCFITNSIDLTNVKTIESKAFQNATLPLNFIIDLNVTLEKNAFLGFKLNKGDRWSQVDEEGYPIKGSKVIKIETIIPNQYKGQKLNNYKIPNEITKIGANAFQGTGYFWKIPIGSNSEFKLTQEEIPSYVPNGNINLISINDPDLWENVKQVDGNTFTGISSLVDISNLKNIVNFKENAFAGSSYVIKNNNNLSLTQAAFFSNDKDKELVNVNDNDLLENINTIKVEALKGSIITNNRFLDWGPFSGIIEEKALYGTGMGIRAFPNGNDIGKEYILKKSLSSIYANKNNLIENLDFFSINDSQFILQSVEDNVLVGSNLIWKIPIAGTKNFELTQKPLDAKLSTYNSSFLKDINDLDLMDDVITIDNNAFAYTNLPENFKIPSSVKEIKEGAFEETLLNEKFYIAKNSTIHIYNKAFENVKFPKNFIWSNPYGGVNAKIVSGEKLINLNL